MYILFWTVCFQRAGSIFKGYIEMGNKGTPYSYIFAEVTLPGKNGWILVMCMWYTHTAGRVCMFVCTYVYVYVDLHLYVFLLAICICILLLSLSLSHVDAIFYFRVDTGMSSLNL